MKIARCLGISIISSTLWASGFQLFESNSVTVGDYGSGAVSTPEDASIGFSNPAGLVYLDRQQMTFSQTLLRTYAGFRGDATVDVPGNPLITGGPFSVGRDQSTKDSSFHLIPSFHYSVPVNPSLAVGFGLTIPFGLATNWGDQSVVRYEATKSQITTVNLGPTFGYRINDQWSIGGGVDFQYLRTSLDLMTFSGVDRPDGRSKNRASSFAVGANAGVMLRHKNTTMGLHGRLPVRHHATGHSEVFGGLVTGSRRSDIQTDVTLPGTVSFGVTHHATDKLAVKANVVCTFWSSVRDLAMKNVSTPSGPHDVTISQNFRDTFRFAVGLDYRVNEKWLLRTGVGLDQSPVDNQHRIIRLPDNNRYAVAAGFRYNINQDFDFDLGYTHIFVKKASIDHHQRLGAQESTLQGEVKGSADLLAAQLTWYL